MTSQQGLGVGFDAIQLDNALAPNDVVPDPP